MLSSARLNMMAALHRSTRRDSITPHSFIIAAIAPIVITTGGSGEDPKFNEGGVGREYLKTLGIPDDQLIAETQSTYTAESARRVAIIMRANSMHSCIAVSDGYHLFRIKHMMAREGFLVYASPRVNSRPPGFWRRQESIFHEIASFTLWASASHVIFRAFAWHHLMVWF